MTDEPLYIPEDGDYSVELDDSIAQAAKDRANTHGGSRRNSGRKKRTWPKNCVVIYQVSELVHSEVDYYSSKQDVISFIGKDRYLVNKLIVRRPTNKNQICNLLNQIGFVVETIELWDGWN